ncbi:MAG TPA: single-stranded-DNA-specific exonuclease RecJ [Candidatus Cloacimonetes bacterium]|nr:single-stranded-DNA-specific exonuclease RecJ [Candidatus Cloacimonadota bacterium]HEX37489.1 single-stranded-DNA-specific exonuclease RecJ [Candidatus Cloacimonadota bacterium]
MRKKWIREAGKVNKELVNRLVEAIGCPQVIARLLLQYDIDTPEKAEIFFNPSIEDLHDPYIFRDMQKAVERINLAIQRNEKIIIYGDYDVDGTTATSILLMGLSELGANVEFYIPNRMIEGYGLSITGNKAIETMNADLVITVDCGINAVDEINDLNENGIDVIVTDHHTPKETLPEAYAIIDPKLKDSKYPYSELSGAGIALKLLTGLFKYLGKDKHDVTERYCDLAGLGTIADIVPLTGENRIIARLGIERLQQRKNIGINYLLNLSGLKKLQIKSSDIVFKLAPRINAAGRMGSADRAVELMTATSPDLAKKLALSIDSENFKRQKIDQETFRTACNMIEAKYPNMNETYFIVLAAEDWHPGVIGIVASKIVEKYNRPTILITLSEGEGSGSGRSIQNFDIFECLSKYQDYLISFGGHKYAAGLTILPEYIDLLEKKLNEYARDRLSVQEIQPQISVIDEINLQDIDEELIKWLKMFAPFGPGNMNPIFMSTDVMVVGYPYTVGMNHLKIKGKQKEKTLDMIGFNMGDLVPFLKKGSKIDIAYSLEENNWQNISKIQGKLKDIRPTE